MNLSSTSSSSSTNWELVGNTVTSSDFSGTTNNTDLDIRTNNIQRMTIKNDGKVGVASDSPSGIFEVDAPLGENVVANLSSNTSSNITLSGSSQHNHILIGMLLMVIPRLIGVLIIMEAHGKLGIG